MSSPLYNVDDAIVFFILASLLILRMLPFSTHCWYRGTHICTESTKPPNLLTLVRYTERISKSTIYCRPSAAMTVYHPKLPRGTRKKQQRAMGNLHMATSLHMAFVRTEKWKIIYQFSDRAKPFIWRWVIEWKIEKPDEALMIIKLLKWTFSGWN